jgi:ABC-type glycerol-3-phosphate transport system substrate-binding protein
MTRRLCLVLALVLPLAACGGGGGSSTPSGGAAVTGVTTPSSVSVVTAN